MKRNVTVVVGGQYGSESKGKIIDYLADEFDVAIRTGSPNAGHTIVRGDKKYKLRQIPSSIFNLTCQLYIGPGALIDPQVLYDEVFLSGLNIKNRIVIDEKAGIITDKNKLEESGITKEIGSTGSGTGYAQIDRIKRKDFRLVRDVIKDIEIGNVSVIVNKKIDEGAKILVEGTQGFGLSILHGEYPFVTSRDTTASAFISECGISPLCVKDIILVIRTYPIRVAGNSGPFPNEISWDELSKRIGKEVIEITTVTKKTRRIAEFDIDVVKRAIEVNRPTQIALQFLNYVFPKDEGKNKWEDLNSDSQDYILKLEKELEVPIVFIGTGADHKEMVDRRGELGFV